MDVSLERLQRRYDAAVIRLEIYWQSPNRRLARVAQVQRDIQDLALEILARQMQVELHVK